MYSPTISQPITPTKAPMIAGTRVVQSMLAEGWLADDPNATLAAL